MENKFLSIDEMKERIEEYGQKRMWNLIEEIKNPIDRIAYRQLFFLAGGILEDIKEE